MTLCPGISELQGLDIQVYRENWAFNVLKLLYVNYPDSGASRRAFSIAILSSIVS